MNLEDACYPVLALRKKSLCVFANYDGVIRCYRALLSNTYQGTIFLDGACVIWRCKDARIIRSLIPFWKKLFVADLVVVEPICDGTGFVVEFDEIRKMVRDCVKRSSSFAVDTESVVSESEREKDLINQIDLVVDEASSAGIMIDGIQKVIVRDNWGER